MFTLLNELSQEISDDEMKNAYQDFVEQIKLINNSNDYMYIFRTLTLVRIDFLETNRKKNVLQQIYFQKSLSFIDSELELLHLKIQHPEQFELNEDTFKSNLYIIPKSKGLGIIGFVELIVALFLLGEIYTKGGKLASLSDIARVFEQMFNLNLGCIFKKRIALNLLIKEGNKQNEK